MSRLDIQACRKPYSVMMAAAFSSSARKARRNGRKLHQQRFDGFGCDLPGVCLLVDQEQAMVNQIIFGQYSPSRRLKSFDPGVR